MFIADAYAQGPEPIARNPLLELIPFVFIFIIFYFLLIRPQQNARKKHMEMIAAVKKGDEVVTSGGIVGKVTKVIDDKEIMVEIADKIAVKVVRATLSDVRTKADGAANDQ
jgi:preprotein translocase subunit YajC